MYLDTFIKAAEPERKKMDALKRFDASNLLNIPQSIIERLEFSYATSIAGSESGYVSWRDKSLIMCK